MRVFIDLSINYAPHEITKRLKSFEQGGHISFNQWSIRLAFSQSWLCMTMGTSSWSEHSYLPFWQFVFPSWLKFFSSEKKIIWFGFGGLLLVRKGVSKAAKFAYSAGIFLEITKNCLLHVIPEMLSFSIRPPKYFYDKPLPKYLISKTVLIYCPHPEQRLYDIKIIRIQDIKISHLGTFKDQDDARFANE